MTYEQVMERLYDLADNNVVIQKKERFGLAAQNALGIFQKDLKTLEKEIGKDNELAIKLFDNGIYEARILCSKIFDVNFLTETLADKWVKTFENWEICDSFSMGLFAKSRLAVKKIYEWTESEREFEKRAGFAVIASYCMADKKAENGVFESFLPIIKRESVDQRNYVKKAVNWALRNIGKRNIDLNKKAIETAEELLLIESKSSIWIGKDALRELRSPKANILNYPRHIYQAKS